ncbi:response regulator [Thermodesulfobacteriota bacterium]
MKKKVLVVDNNRVILRLVSRFLEKQGYDVKTAEDGLQALKTLHHFIPEIMFIDLIMPKINGEKLCRIIRKMPECDDVSLIIISAVAREDKVDYLSFGADACIAKGPFKDMQGHILTVLDLIDNKNIESLAGEILGLEGIYERGVTKELLTTNRHFEMALDNMADGFLEMTADTSIIYANRAASELLGVSEERLLSSSLAEFFTPEQHQLIKNYIALLEDRIVEIGSDDPILLNENYLHIKLVPFVDNNQKYVIVLINNISEQKRVELELRMHKDDLEKAVRERTAALEEKNTELEEALSKVKLLSGFLPICASCKKIRDDKGYWNQIEVYIRKNSEARFSHGVCPACAKKLYSEYKLYDE